MKTLGIETISIWMICKNSFMTFVKVVLPKLNHQIVHLPIVVFLSFLRGVLKGMQQTTSKGCSAWDVCENNVTRSSPNVCACSIASRVTWDPWPWKMNRCLFVRKIPPSFDLLKKKRNYLKRTALTHASNCIAIEVLGLQS